MLRRRLEGRKQSVLEVAEWELRSGQETEGSRQNEINAISEVSDSIVCHHRWDLIITSRNRVRTLRG